MSLKPAGSRALANERLRGPRGILNDAARNPYIYLMLLPAILFYLVFFYAPMLGLSIAFKDYSVGRGIIASPWIGLRHFRDFFVSYYFWRSITNTILINFYDLLFGFPAPIIFALLLNELRGTGFKRTVQTITYTPSFHLDGRCVRMLVDFLAADGLVNSLVDSLGLVEPVRIWRLRSTSGRSTSAPASGRSLGGAASSIWRPSRPSTLSSTTRRRSTALGVGASLSASPCQASCLPSS